jgi:hypothetical protein
MLVTNQTLSKDRELGTVWEANFEIMMTGLGFWCHRLQEGRDKPATIAVYGTHIIAPDVMFGRK